MNSVGIDLHKNTIAVCVVDKDRKVRVRKSFLCADTAGITRFFTELGEFQFVVEATAAYEWLVRLLEPLAAKWVLCHPGKMRLIAATTKKTDKLDAQVLAEFLALGMIPKAYAPPPRQREHRVLVRLRQKCRQRVTQVKCQIRYLAATYNADRRDLFLGDGLDQFAAKAELSGADRFAVQTLQAELEFAQKQLAKVKAELDQFASRGSAEEQKLREVLRSVPGVGSVVSEIVLAELGDATRFGSLKQATAYAGLVPTQRESAGKSKELGITKRGSRLLRWAMIEAAWLAVQNSPRWRGVYEALKKRRGSKKAIVAVARRLLAVLCSMMKSGQKYRWSVAELAERKVKVSAREAAKEAKRLKAKEAREAKRAAKEAVAV